MKGKIGLAVCDFGSKNRDLVPNVPDFGPGLVIHITDDLLIQQGKSRYMSLAGTTERLACDQALFRFSCDVSR